MPEGGQASAFQRPPALQLPALLEQLAAGGLGLLRLCERRHHEAEQEPEKAQA